MILIAIIPKFTPLEQNLLRLGWLRNEFQTMYSEYPVSSRPESEFHLRAIVRYFLVIRLDDFVAIRSKLCKQLLTLKKLELDDALKPFWEPIDSHAGAIHKLRNKYLAHLQSQEDFQVKIEEIISKLHFPKSHGDARYFAGCAWKYCHFVILNFPNEFAGADVKYRSVPPEKHFTINIPDEAHAASELNKAQDEAIIKLQAKGFRVS